MRGMPARVLLLLAALALAAPALAAKPTVPAFGDAVPDRENLTYLDLVRLIAPELVPGGTSRLVAMRRIDGTQSQRQTAAKLTIAGVTPLDTSRRIVMLLDGSETPGLEEGLAVLVVFDLRGSKPRVVSAVDVGLDRMTAFGEPALTTVAKDTWLIRTDSSHLNAGQSYGIAVLSLLRGGRLGLVDTVQTLSDQGCGFERKQSVAVAPGAMPQDGLAPVEVTLSETVTKTSEDCGSNAPALPKPLPEARATYRWDRTSGAYAPDSQAIKAIETETGQRF